MQIKRGDQIINLVGQPLAVGDALPNVELLNQDRQAVQLGDYINGVSVISIVPDINTKTCSIQTSRFNQLAKEKDYPIITLSNNQPEDIVNWCSSNDVDMVYLSDLNGQFSEASGLLMAEYDKLARTVMLVDADGIIRYIEIVADMRDEPDYDKVLEAADKLK